MEIIQLTLEGRVSDSLLLPLLLLVEQLFLLYSTGTGEITYAWSIKNLVPLILHSLINIGTLFELTFRTIPHLCGLVGEHTHSDNRCKDFHRFHNTIC